MLKLKFKDLWPWPICQDHWRLTEENSLSLLVTVVSNLWPFWVTTSAWHHKTLLGVSHAPSCLLLLKEPLVVLHAPSCLVPSKEPLAHIWNDWENICILFNLKWINLQRLINPYPADHHYFRFFGTLIVDIGNTCVFKCNDLQRIHLKLNKYELFLSIRSCRSR